MRCRQHNTPGALVQVACIQQLQRHALWLIWTPVIVLMVQIACVLISGGLGYRSTANGYAFFSLALTASGLMVGLAALPFARRLPWLLRATIPLAYLPIEMCSMIASGF